jgi:hypothetical protein
VLLQAPGLLHELLHEEAGIQLVVSGGFLARHPYCPLMKTRAREPGKPTPRLEIDAAQAWQGWDFGSRQTVLQTAGLECFDVRYGPLKFDPRPRRSIVRGRPPAWLSSSWLSTTITDTQPSAVTCPNRSVLLGWGWKHHIADQARKITASCDELAKRPHRRPVGVEFFYGQAVI